MTAHPLMGRWGAVSVSSWEPCPYAGPLGVCLAHQGAKGPVSAYAPPPLSPAMTMMGWISASFCLHCFSLSLSLHFPVLEPLQSGIWPPVAPASFASEQLQEVVTSTRGVCSNWEPALGTPFLSIP